MNNKKNLIWVAVILIIIILLALYFFVFQKDKEFVVRDKDSFTSQDDYLNYLEEYKLAQSRDTYGGKTPEETLNLFVEALKAGNTELASKYFILSKQDQIREELKIGKQNDVLKLLIGDLEKEKKGINLSDTSYRFRTYDKNGLAEFSFDLILNEESKLWKIESL